MTLDHGGRPSDGNTFDHVRVKRSLREKPKTVTRDPRPVTSFGKIDDCVFEYANEFVANDFSFLFRIGYAFERPQKTVAGVNIFETNMEIFSEDALNDFFLA